MCYCKVIARTTETKTKSKIISHSQRYQPVSIKLREIFIFLTDHSKKTLQIAYKLIFQNSKPLGSMINILIEYIRCVCNFHCIDDYTIKNNKSYHENDTRFDEDLIKKNIHVQPRMLNSLAGCLTELSASDFC